MLHDAPLGVRVLAAQRFGARALEGLEVPISTRVGTGGGADILTVTRSASHVGMCGKRGGEEAMAVGECRDSARGWVPDD